MNTHAQVILRPATMADARALEALEKASFDTDRLSLRSIRHWIKATNRVMSVAEFDGEIVGYALAILYRGTRLARLYSIAVATTQRGTGLSKRLLHDVEAKAATEGRLYMRLEVAQNNYAALKLYGQNGYQVFGSYKDYYDDHQDAVRMQKRIRYRPQNSLSRNVPWYQQTTEFTCGPAALIMAMASLSEEITPEQSLELDIWREATTIFMTSGVGGCHPVGLALAAKRRGFKPQVYLNIDEPLFINGVRQPQKKDVIATVDKQFRKQAKKAGIKIKSRDITQVDIQRWLGKNAMVIMLISTYRMDGRKAPHWVTITGMDDRCLYVHDPDLDTEHQEQIDLDCQHVPIARQDFEKMSSFGREKLRTAVILER